MTWTYDPSTPLGMVRLRVSDTNPDRRIMDDEEYSAFLSMAGDSVPLAAAMALETIAVNEVLCLKVVNLMGAVVTDAASAAKQLLSMAKQLRAEATSGIDGGTGFVSIEMVDGVDMRREKYAKYLEETSI
jgi:hypothetical protein